MAIVYSKKPNGYEGLYGNRIDENDGVTSSADIIFGTALKDEIFGLGGDDVFKGGGGADRLHGGSGIDTADYSDSNEGVKVSLMAGAGVGGTAQGDKLFEIENLSGSAHDDELQGDENANTLYGREGNDLLKGAGGADKLFGGAGDDQLNSDAVGDFLDGGADNDTVNFSEAQVGVYVNLETGYYNRGLHFQPVPPGTPQNIVNVENVFGSNGVDHITGSSVDNYLYGNDGVDHIWGRAGNDTIDGGNHMDFIDGGIGDDTLTGGAGNDSFIFGVYGDGPVNFGHDTITDFTDGDKIKISNEIFSDFDDLQDHMHQVGNDVVIIYDDGNSITLENTNINSMNANDFLFY